MATILIVDDRSLNRQYLVTLLRYCGYRTLEAGDGAEALALGVAERPDLVITDILMPTMDGAELVHAMRADPVLADTPVIFYSAIYHEAEAHAVAAGCGVSIVLSKFDEPEVVLKAVNEALGSGTVYPEMPAGTNLPGRDLGLLTDVLGRRMGDQQRSASRLAAIIELGLDLTVEDDPASLVERFCKGARDIVSTRFASVGLLGEEGCKLAHFFNDSMSEEGELRLPAPFPLRGNLRQIVADGKPQRLSGTLHWSDLGLAELHPALFSFLGVAVATARRTYGWLCFCNKVGGSGFTDEDERLAITLAAQLAVVYENVVLHAKAERDAEALRLQGAALETAANAILITDCAGAILWVNPAFCTLTGYASEEVIGKTPRLLKSGKYEEVFYQNLWKTILSGETWRGEFVNRGKNESLYVVEQTITPVRCEGGKITHFIAIMNDVTDGKRIEERFIQAQKMEVVGQLAGGVAHDFNNIIGVIMGYSDLLASEPGQNSTTMEYIGEIRSAAERAAALTGQLLIFSRKQAVELTVLDLESEVRDLDQMLRRLIDENVEMTIVTAEEPGFVKADSGYIGQVLMNLVVNARDAMPDGGKLSIATSNITLEKAHTRSHACAVPGDYVMLSVTDTGTGMTEEVKARLFEAFFTTKPQGKGTGLGLATCQAIVHQSGGHIGVDSELGKGTTFKIYFPRVEAPQGVASKPACHGPLPRGTETLLVVEDDASVRHLARGILEAQGYEVLTASNGHEALHVASEHLGAPIRLAVTDVIMPVMGGKVMAEWLTVTYPDLKILFTSGYTDDSVARHGVLKEEVELLPKPYTPAILARKVREILDAAP